MSSVVIIKKSGISITKLLEATETASKPKQMAVKLVDNYGPENKRRFTPGKEYSWENTGMNPTTLTSIATKDWRVNINYVTGKVTCIGDVTCFLDMEDTY